LTTRSSAYQPGGIRSAPSSNPAADLQAHHTRASEGQPDVPLAQRPFIDIEAISPRWFETMRVPLRNGRTFTSHANAAAPAVIIVNESFARQFWPGQSAIGKKVIIGRKPLPALVVAVAADIKNQGLEKESQPQLYLPFPQLPWSDMNLLVRTEIPSEAAISTIRAQIAAVDSSQPVDEIQTAEDLIGTSRAQPRFTMLLVGGFSATALLLAIVGVYGVLSYSVGQRRQEFGIRLALGAHRSDILRIVMRQAMLLAICGISAGLCGALALTRFLEHVLYKTGSHDLATFILARQYFCWLQHSPVIFLPGVP
jgi:hypothetical protein